MSLDQFEPSSCSCDQCRQTCRTRPGFCAPGDVERIAAHVGMSPAGDFLQDHFRPLGGPLVQFGDPIDCDPVNVPVIVPAQREDGCCVFLTADGRCGIQPVKPTGCAVSNACQGGNAAAEAAIAYEIAHDLEYLDLWCALVYDPEPVVD